jgi:O-antigen/teichoic acid export membrane protein
LLLSMASSYLALVLQLASTVIIARVLTPAEIGVFAVAAVFSSVASMLRDFGVAEYMIQERDLTREKVSATLTLNIGVSWLMAGLMFFGGPLAASFYSNAGIQRAMSVMALGFVLVPFGAVTMAYLRREMNFMPQLLCNMAGATTSFLVSVSLALLGFGYMSLAWSMVAGIAATVAVSMFYRPSWFPRWPGLKGTVEIFHFSKFASLIYIVAQLGKGAPELIIGRAQGVAEVAMFSRAGGLVEMFNKLALRPVMSVCMPYFARADREGGSVSEAYLRGVAFVTGVGWPLLAFTGVAAYSAIHVVYGPQWGASVHLAQILCCACAVELVHVMSREVLLSRGCAREANNLQMGLVGLQVAGLSLAIPFGLVGAAYGVALSAAAGVVLSQRALKQAIGLCTRDMFRACRSSLALSLIAVSPAAAWALIEGVHAGNYVRFGLLGSVSTCLLWLLAVRCSAHPLKPEVDRVLHRLRTVVFRQRAV